MTNTGADSAYMGETILNKKTKTIVWIVVAVVAVLLMGVLLSDVINQTTELTFNEFVAKLASGEITELYVDAYNWTGYTIVDGKKVAGYTTVAPSIYDYASFQALIASMGGKLSFSVQFTDPNAGSMLSSLFPILGVVAVSLIFFFIMRSASGANNATMNIGKSKAQMQSNLKVRFSDVAGAEEEKEELREVVEFLKSPKKFSNLCARIP